MTSIPVRHHAWAGPYCDRCHRAKCRICGMCPRDAGIACRARYPYSQSTLKAWKER